MPDSQAKQSGTVPAPVARRIAQGGARADVAASVRPLTQALRDEAIQRGFPMNEDHWHVDEFFPQNQVELSLYLDWCSRAHRPPHVASNWQFYM